MESVLMISPDMSVIHLITYLHPARDKLLDKLIEIVSAGCKADHPGAI